MSLVAQADSLPPIVNRPLAALLHRPQAVSLRHRVRALR